MALIRGHGPDPRRRACRSHLPSSLRIDAPISIGELIDKITILEIKGARISDRDKAANVARELALLRDIKSKAGLDGAAIDCLADELRTVNAALWDIEDHIREHEAGGDFGPSFVALARGVYHNNDQRSRIKQRISAACPAP